MYWALYLQIVDFTKQRIINIILGQSHDAVCVFIIWVTTTNWTKILLDLNVAVILTSFL